MNDNHDFEEEFFEANGNWTNEVDWETSRIIGECHCEYCKAADEMYASGQLGTIFDWEKSLKKQQIQPLEQLKWDEDSILDTLAFIQKLPGGK